MNGHAYSCDIEDRKRELAPVHTIPNKEIRMLVLTRKMDEQIVIQVGDQTVVVRVVGMVHDRVRLGITAPADVTVHREEVARRLAGCQDNVATALASPTPLG